MHGLKEQRRATSTSHVGNTFVYLRKQPVLCFANETQAKWFSLNGSSLCVIGWKPSEQCDVRARQLEGFCLPKTQGGFRGRHTLWCLLYTETQCSAPHHTRLSSVSLAPTPCTCTCLHFSHVTGKFIKASGVVINTYVIHHPFLRKVLLCAQKQQQHVWDKLKRAGAVTQCTEHCSTKTISG